MCVNDLLDEQFQAWNKPKIESIFTSRDITEILTIPLFHTSTAEIQEEWDCLQVEKDTLVAKVESLSSAEKELERMGKALFEVEEKAKARGEENRESGIGFI